MTTSPNTPTTLPPTPLAQAETLLTKIRGFQHTFKDQATQPGTRLLAFGNAIGLMVFPKNQPILDNLGAEAVLALRQEFMHLALEQYANLPSLYAESVGLEMPPEPVQEAVSEKEDSENVVEVAPDIKRWTRQNVVNWVNTPLDPEKLTKITGHTGRKDKLTHLHNIPKVDTVVELLGRYGLMTTYQVVATLLNQENSDSTAIPLSIFSRAREALRILELKELVAGTEVTGWDKGSLKFWRLLPPGKIYNAIITDQPNPSAQELTAKAVQLQHFFGTNQVLSSIAAVAVVANRLGVFEHVVSTVLKENPRLNTSDRSGLDIPAVKMAKSLEWARQPKNKQPTETAFGCRVELMRSGTALEIGQIERKAIVPDGMGRIIYDTDLVIPTLIQACNLDDEESTFSGSSVTGRHYWPFILEYDRSTEGVEFFAEKVEAYSRFYNTIQTAWPLEWGDNFPVILVVVEGSPVRILTLMTAIRTALFKLQQINPANKRLGNWWFTSTEWFHEVYQAYLDPAGVTAWHKKVYPGRTTRPKGGGRSPKPGTAAAAVKPKIIKIGTEPRIWLPLDTSLEKYDLLAVSKYLKGEVTQRPSKMSLMKALPLPAVLNELP